MCPLAQPPRGSLLVAQPVSAAQLARRAGNGGGTGLAPRVLSDGSLRNLYQTFRVMERPALVRVRSRAPLSYNLRRPGGRQWLNAPHVCSRCRSPHSPCNLRRREPHCGCAFPITSSGRGHVGWASVPHGHDAPGSPFGGIFQRRPSSVAGARPLGMRRNNFYQKFWNS